MRALRSLLPRRLNRKLCLACGYDGPSIQGYPTACALRCPNCGEDLYARPPRSYAELEGLDEEPEIEPPNRRGPAPIQPTSPITNLWRRIRRWLVQL